MINVCSGRLTVEEIAQAQADGRFQVDENSFYGYAALRDNVAIDRLAQSAYHAYGAQTDYKNYQGNPMPEWTDLPQGIKSAWRNAVADILGNIGLDSGNIQPAKPEPQINLLLTTKPFNPVPVDEA